MPDFLKVCLALILVVSMTGAVFYASKSIWHNCQLRKLGYKPLGMFAHWLGHSSRHESRETRR